MQDHTAQKTSIELVPFEDAGKAVEAARKIYESSIEGIKNAVASAIAEIHNAQFGNTGPVPSKEAENDALFRRGLKRSLIEPIASQALNWTYPIIVLRPYSFVDLEPENYDYERRSPNFYDCTFSKLTTPDISERLRHDLDRIQRGLGPGFYGRVEGEQSKHIWRPLVPIYVGKSKTPIPVTFALRDWDIRMNIEDRVKPNDYDALPEAQKKTIDQRVKALSERAVKIIQDVFPLPNLVDISERIVDEAGRRAEIDERRFRVLPSEFANRIYEKFDGNAGFNFAIQKDDKYLQTFSKETLEYLDFDDSKFKGITTRDLRPLAYYDGPRTDYSCVRLEHYCHTNFDCFQPFALLTNYKKYVEAFLNQIVREYVAKGSGQLFFPSFELDESIELGLSEKLKKWLIGGRKQTLGVDQAWVLEHVELGKNGEETAQSDTQIQQGGLLNRLPLQQWIGLWVNNFSAQMPAYHYVPAISLAEAERKKKITSLWEDHIDLDHHDAIYLPGITLVNIGVGPSNAKNLTDNMAVVRPIAWLMLGHCGGLRTTLKIGDFVLAQGYVRDDRILDEELPLQVPIPEIFEITEAIRAAARSVLYQVEVKKWEARNQQRESALPSRSYTRLLGLRGYARDKKDEFFSEDDWARVELRKRLRVGTVVTTADRNWELSPLDKVIERFDKSRAIAIDMESATIAANRFRHRIFYGTLLCVSDRPIFGAIKMRGMASAFYDEATSLHLTIGIEAVKRIMAKRYRLAASRKISGFDDPLVGL